MKTAYKNMQNLEFWSNGWLCQNTDENKIKYIRKDFTFWSNGRLNIKPKNNE